LAFRQASKPEKSNQNVISILTWKADNVVCLRHKTSAMVKKEIFDQDLQELAAFGKAISHPARLAI
jgi:hypothetical protein